MDSKTIDETIKTMLHDLPYLSLMKTSLSIRLADYAAQQCGFRSTRQIDGKFATDINDKYTELNTILFYNINEILILLKKDHEYKYDIQYLDKEQLEILLENTLFEMTTYNCYTIFKYYFFKSNDD